jgi:hypothetical protein
VNVDKCSGIVRFVVRTRNIRNRLLFYADVQRNARTRKRSRMFPNSEFETAEEESGVDGEDEDNPAPPMPVLPLRTQLSPLSSYAIASPMRA